MGDKKMINPFHEILLILVHILFFFGKSRKVRKVPVDI